MRAYPLGFTPTSVRKRAPLFGDVLEWGEVRGRALCT